ncbi:wax ester/triacylglycerol synthase domain-containing protein [Microbacterium luteum]|uniref:wax ester/triacylglycerol synthase domain-containing protein n=2 Tax=Microbacterium TaxID=33882 RepID=UPI0018887A7A|nr:wax ester/triacylglycerol synthase domain-containing protein [Microbacterium luteum]
MSTTVTASDEIAPVRLTRPHAEFMQIWEEGYVSNHISFENMQTPGLLIAEGGPLLRPDGSLDRVRIRAFVQGAVASTESFRLRLQRSFLGLTPPAWVPDDDFDLDRHLVFSDAAVDPATADLRRLSGAEDPVFSLRHPLWRIRITALTDGRVAVGMMFHHAMTDGLSGMRLFSTVTQARADEPFPEPRDPFAAVQPARAWHLPGLALEQWWHREGSLGAAWRSYWSRPVLRRIRRVGARLLLPLRYGRGGEAARRAALPPRHSAYRALDAGLAGRRAREHGGTLSDLQAAAMVGAWPGEQRVVSLRFPVSFHSSAASHIRNHVRDMSVSGDADADLAATVRAIHRQVEERDDDKPYPAAPGLPIGYSTLLPWVSRPRFFAGAKILDVAPFPASLGTDSLAAAGIMYNGRLFIGANMSTSADVEQTVGRMYELMTGLPDPGRPVA